MEVAKLTDEKKSKNELLSPIRVRISIKADVPDTLSLIDCLNLTRFRVLSQEFRGSNPRLRICQ